MTAGRLFACYKQTGVPVAFSSDTSSGCDTQHPLRLCLRLAGHGPNNSSLLPPMAAVTVVAGHSIARPIAFGNRVPPQRTVLRETPGPPARSAFCSIDYFYQYFRFYNSSVLYYNEVIAFISLIYRRNLPCW